MAGRKITIEFLGDSKDLQNAIGDVDGKSSKLGATLGKVGKAAAIGLGAGLVIGGAALVKMTQGAIEDEAAQAKLAKTLQNAAGATKGQVAAVEDWISAQGIALGVTDDDLRPALQRLTEATGDVGKAQSLTSLAMDISAGTGKSLKTVSEALAKAQMGQVGGLSRYGIATRDASGEMMSFEDVVKRASGTFEGQAATAANTLDGKMARLKLIMAEAGETIGSKLIPVVTQMADWFLNKGLPAIQKFGGWISSNILPVLQKFGSDGSSMFTKVRNAMEPVIATVVSIAQKIGNNLRPVFEQLVDTFRSKVVPTVGLIIDRFQEWQPAISKVVTKLYDVGSTIIGKVLPPVVRFAGFLLSTLVPVVLDAVEVMTTAKEAFTVEQASAVAAEIGIEFERVEFDVEQFRRGMEVELEHGSQDPVTNVTNDDPILTGKIAWAHLREFPDYYDRLDRMEAEAEGKV